MGKSLPALAARRASTPRKFLAFFLGNWTVCFVIWACKLGSANPMPVVKFRPMFIPDRFGFFAMRAKFLSVKRTTRKHETRKSEKEKAIFLFLVFAFRVSCFSLFVLVYPRRLGNSDLVFVAFRNERNTIAPSGIQDDRACD